MAAQWIDNFVLARLEGEGLKPSPEADKTTLVRRLYIDLIGLPPTPEEVDAFIADKRPRAYERWSIDCSLRPTSASGWPCTGSIWCGTPTRSAITATRSTASRPIAIRSSTRSTATCRSTSSLASNWRATCCPVRRSAKDRHRLQPAAADVARRRRAAQGIPGDLRGRPRAKCVGRVDGRDVGLAQCHDHKFDPYTTQDFYSMAAFFADVDEATSI